MKKISKIESFLLILAMIIMAIVFLFPSFWTVLTSFKIRRDALSIPPKFFFTPIIGNYRELFSGRFEGGSIFSIFFPNSLIIALCSTGLTLILSTLAGYSLARFRFFGRKGIGFFILATRMLPPIGVVIPLFLMMTSLKLVDTRLGLILAYAALNVPLGTWILKGFIEGVPREIEECAKIDGCSLFSVLAKIVFPLVAPGLAAVAALSFMLSWNDFALALFLTSSQAKTLPVSLASFQTEQGIVWGPMSAMATIVAVPVILFVLLTQKYIVKGLTLGSIK